MTDHGYGVVLRPDLAVLARHRELYGSDDRTRLRRLAAALAASPLWDDLGSRLALAVRTQGIPLLAALGLPGPDDGPRLAALGWQVDECLARLRPVSMDRTLELCEVLAQRIEERLGPRLAGATVTGIPRGGLVVAGLLAARLGRPVGAQAVPGGVLVVVDDCCLSGARLRAWLGDRPDGDVVVAHLHSAPELRAVVERDEQVLACIAAEDLHDHAPAAHGPEYESWRRRWRDRSPDDYWTGHPDHVAYVWNEPDMVFWNDVTGRAEAGWRVVPPQWCLKNRAQQADAPVVQVCHAAGGEVGPPPGVIWATLGERIVVADGTTGSAGILTEVAADCWQAIVESGDTRAATAALVERYRAPADRIRSDLEDFIDDCQGRGILVRA